MRMNGTGMNWNASGSWNTNGHWTGNGTSNVNVSWNGNASWNAGGHWNAGGNWIDAGNCSGDGTNMTAAITTIAPGAATTPTARIATATAGHPIATDGNAGKRMTSIGGSVMTIDCPTIPSLPPATRSPLDFAATNRHIQARSLTVARPAAGPSPRCEA